MHIHRLQSYKTKHYFDSEHTLIVEKNARNGQEKQIKYLVAAPCMYRGCMNSWAVPHKGWILVPCAEHFKDHCMQKKIEARYDVKI